MQIPEDAPPAFLTQVEVTVLGEVVALEGWLMFFMHML